MHNAIKIICDKLIANPESAIEGARMTEWTRAALLVLENKRKIFTEEEIDTVKAAWREAERMNFFGVIVEMVHDKSAAKRLPLVQQELEHRDKQTEETQFHDMLRAIKRSDPQLAQQMERDWYLKNTPLITRTTDNTNFWR